MNTFFHFNVMIIYSDDIVIQRINRIRCSENDLMMLLSHNARTKNLVELADENDTMVLNIAATCSPLTHKTTFALLLDVLENTDIYMLMAS